MERVKFKQQGTCHARSFRLRCLTSISLDTFHICLHLDHHEKTSDGHENFSYAANVFQDLREGILHISTLELRGGGATGIDIRKMPSSLLGECQQSIWQGMSGGGGCSEADALPSTISVLKAEEWMGRRGIVEGQEEIAKVTPPLRLALSRHPQ